MFAENTYIHKLINISFSIHLLVRYIFSKIIMICLKYITFISMLIDNIFSTKYIIFISMLIDNIFIAKLLHDMFAENTLHT